MAQRATEVHASQAQARAAGWFSRRHKSRDAHAEQHARNLQRRENKFAGAYERAGDPGKGQSREAQARRLAKAGPAKPHNPALLPGNVSPRQRRIVTASPTKQTRKRG